ncbi:MAG: hypothetical protein CVU06_15410 [Bacteroidetes bacterium HGW-Bacteroidetes-22]|nr:MAG: hypothetical protein CVU06_15410 [Bacteroidetes bacterium HGW-Bacteroidetes-22]
MVISATTNFSKPIYVVGHEVYLEDIILHSNNKNAYDVPTLAQPTVNLESIIKLNPDIVILLAPYLHQSSTSKEELIKAWKSIPINASQKSHIYVVDKEYAGTFVLGATTPSFDLEKEVDVRWPDAHITEFMIRQSAAAMTGPQMQIPPVFSAVKVDGKRAYDYARDNQEVIIAPKPIVITEFEITRVAMPEVGFRIVCSKGTYIRAIARDFGLALGSGAYMSELRRTRSGEFRVTDAFDPETFCQQLKEITPDGLGKAI